MPAPDSGSSVPAGPASFDVRGLQSNGHGVGSIILGFGVAFLVLWAVAVLPHYFESPSTLNVCSRGACTTANSGSYYGLLDLYTVLVFLLVLAFFGVGLAIYRAPRPNRISLTAEGVEFAYPSGPPSLLRWNDPAFGVELDDYSPLPTNRWLVRATPRCLSASGLRRFSGPVGLSEEAESALLRAARAAGLHVEASVGTGGRHEAPQGVRVYWISRR